VRARPLLRETRATEVAYFAACVSVVLAASSFLPSITLRTVASLAGVAIAAALAPTYLRRATPAAAVALTFAAGLLSLAAVLRLSGASFAAGLACSRAGGADSPWAWLFTVASWCLAAGVLSAGYLVISEGSRTRHLGARESRLAALLPLIACAGFFVVGALPIGANRVADAIHDQAAIFAMGSFWLGMVASARAPTVSPPLRRFSGAAAALVILAWLPTEVKLLGWIQASPVKTLHMQLLVFALAACWLAWLAHEWDRA